MIIHQFFSISFQVSKPTAYWFCSVITTTYVKPPSLNKCRFRRWCDSRRPHQRTRKLELPVPTPPVSTEKICPRNRRLLRTQCKLSTPERAFLLIFSSFIFFPSFFFNVVDACCYRCHNNVSRDIINYQIQIKWRMYLKVVRKEKNWWMLRTILILREQKYGYCLYGSRFLGSKFAQFTNNIRYLLYFSSIEVRYSIWMQYIYLRCLSVYITNSQYRYLSVVVFGHSYDIILAGCRLYRNTKYYYRFMVYQHMVSMFNGEKFHRFMGAY